MYMSNTFPSLVKPLRGSLYVLVSIRSGHKCSLSKHRRKEINSYLFCQLCPDKSKTQLSKHREIGPNVYNGGKKVETIMHIIKILTDQPLKRMMQKYNYLQIKLLQAMELRFDIECKPRVVIKLQALLHFRVKCRLRIKAQT